MRSWTRYDLREIQLPGQGATDIVDVLTSDQLRVEVDASFRFRIDPQRARDIYLEIGSPVAVTGFVFNAFRSAVRDAVSEIAAADILSQERAGVGGADPAADDRTGRTSRYLHHRLFSPRHRSPRDHQGGRRTEN